MKNQKTIKIIIAVALSVAIIAGTVVTGLLTNWFGLGLGPMGGLIIAAKNTATSDNFTVEVDDGYNTSEIRYSKVGNKSAILKEDEYGINLRYDGRTYYIANDESYASRYDDELSTDVFDAVDNFKEGKDINWDSLIETFGLDNVIDGKHMGEFVDIMFKDKLRNGEWLEEYLGFSKKGDTYSFEFELDKAYKEIVDIAAEADIIKGSKLKLRNEAQYMEDVVLTAEVVVAGGKLAKVEIELEYKEYDSTNEITFEFSNYGESGIDGEEIEEIFDTVDEYQEKAAEEYAKAHTCEYCGDEKAYGVCYDCDYYGYGYCDSCRYYGMLYSREGSVYCSDCLYNNFEY